MPTEPGSIASSTATSTPVTSPSSLKPRIFRMVPRTLRPPIFRSAIPGAPDGTSSGSTSPSGLPPVQNSTFWPTINSEGKRPIQWARSIARPSSALTPACISTAQRPT